MTRKQLQAVIILVAALTATMCGHAQTVTGNALVLTPTSSYIATGSPNTYVNVATTSSHWLHVSGAANGTFYSFTATLTYGVGTGFGSVGGSAFSCTTDAMGNGNTLHTYEGLTGAVWVADGVGTARALANTNPASVPMFFTKVNGSDAVDFGTYGEG